jgi:MtrB/PioB family decaheme-associated outer membrane protein
MRLRTLLLLIPLAALPAGATAGQTQTPPPPTPPPAPAVSNSATGWVDGGARGTDLSGDDARFNRYRDMGNGAVVDFFRSQFQRGNWFLDANADHVGRTDQRYDGLVVRPGRFKGWLQYDQIPLVMSRTTQTIYTTPSPDVFRINDATQLLLQNTPTAQQPAVMDKVVNTQAAVFDTETTRHIATGGVELTPDRDTTLRVDVQHTNRDGVIPFGATFGFNNAIELPAPVSFHITDVTATAERTAGAWLFEGGYWGQWFNNDNTSIVWDNPYRLTDGTSAPSQGREALAPDNTFLNVHGSASVGLPARSRAAAYVSFGVLDANATVLPQTINTALPVIPLDRATVEGHAHTKTTNLTFTSRPANRLNVDVRYRYYDYDNQTPVWTNTSRIAYDTSVQTLSPASESERYGGSRQWFDADIGLRVGGSTVGVGYSRRQADYQARIFDAAAENTARLRYDVFSTKWLSLRSKYEHAIRRGTGLDTTDIAAAGEQPGMRTYDIADRDRDLFTLIGTVTPASSLVVNLSAGAGKDRFPNSQFGQFNATTGVYSAGVDYTPTPQIAVSASYGYQDLETLQWSRQANPGPQFTDPSRDWSTNGHERTDSVLAKFDILRIHERLDIEIAYDYNHGRTLYTYGTGSVVDRTLPEGSSPDVPTTLPPPSQLPLVFSEVTRGTLDATYALTPHVSIGMRYWYDRYRVDDFALDAQAIPKIDLPNALLIGYQYLPYTAHTYWGRLIVRW